MNRENRTEQSNLKRSLTIATAIMVLSVFLSRVIGLLREQVIAAYGGTSTVIDSYVTAFVIPELLNHFLAGGFLSITFIPIFQRYLSRADHDGAWRAFSNLITLGTIGFIIMIPLSIVVAPDVLRLMGPHISNEQTLPLTIRLTRIILPAQLFFYWGAFFSAVQMAQHRFFLPAMAPLCYNAGIIIGGLALNTRFGIEGFAWGVLGGAFAGNVLVQLPGALKAGMRFRFRCTLKDPDVKMFVFFSLPVVFGLSMSFSNEIFFRFFGSFLGEGGTSSINYALRTMGFIVAIFGQASGVAFYPYLSRLAAEKKYAQITSLLNTLLTRIASYCIPFSLLLMVLAPQVIALLYQHGQFKSASTARTAPIFALYMAGAFAFSAAVFVVRPFYAVQRPYLPMIVSSALSLASLPAYYLTSIRWGAMGIAASAVGGMIAQFLIQYLVWSSLYGDKKSTVSTMKAILVITAISVTAVLPGWAVQHGLMKATLPFGAIVNNLIICTASAIPAAAIVLVAYQTTGIMRIKEITSALVRTVGKAKGR